MQTQLPPKGRSPHESERLHPAAASRNAALEAFVGGERLFDILVEELQTLLG